MLQADALKNADAFFSILLSSGEAMKRDKRLERNFPLFSPIRAKTRGDGDFMIASLRKKQENQGLFRDSDR